jgi:hypothetical protein
LVASEKVVTALPFGMVLVSASLPRKPMSSTLLRYIFFSPFVPICLGRPKDAWSPLQAPTEVDFFGQTVGGTKTFRLESTRERRRAWEFDPKRSRDSERGRRQCAATLVEPLAIWRVDGEIIPRTERHRPQAAMFPKATGFGGVGTDRLAGFEEDVAFDAKSKQSAHYRDLREVTDP